MEDQMAKYSKFQFKTPVKRGMNPVWRGIGCILIVVVPLMAYGLTVLFAPKIAATGKVPHDLLGTIHFPSWVFRVGILGDIAYFIAHINNLWLNIITFFVMLLILTAIASLVYSFVYSLIGPARYTATDAPPPKYKAKKYTR
jgi:hypothetical protein